MIHVSCLVIYAWLATERRDCFSCFASLKRQQKANPEYEDLAFVGILGGINDPLRVRGNTPIAQPWQ